MLLTFKRALTIPVLTAAAVLPMLAAHPAAAHAATTQAAVTSQPAVTSRAAATSQEAVTSQAAVMSQAAVTSQAAATARSNRHRTRRKAAYLWAARQRGAPYCWGGTSGCFDCSGLVMAAYQHEGLHFGRDTTEMLDSSRLIRVGRRRAKKGDLAFYGTGHVELVAGRKYTLGALHSGTLVGWHRVNQWWHPTMYFRIRGAGRPAR
jgi:peptidoglycan DL-endopeptidase CwlO